MKLLLFAYLTSTVVIHAVTACPPEIESVDFQTEFCSANVVFRGNPKSGKSGVGLTPDNRTIEFSTSYFQVDEYFKDTSGQNSKLIAVSRSYIEGDKCDYPIFNGPADSYLVFAKGSEYFRASTCGSDIPWECVPKAARDGFSVPKCFRGAA